MAIDPKNISTSSRTDDLKKKADEQAQAKSESESECKQNLEKLKSKLSESELKLLTEFCDSLEKASSEKVLAPEITKLTANFLGDTELEICSKIIPSFLIACKFDMAERKHVREELLPHVFEANPKRIEAYLKNFLYFAGVSLHPKMLLIKASYREGYFSEKQKQFVCFRYWQGVSTLQAAFLCGDIFIGRMLLDYIFKDNLLLKENKLHSHEIQRLWVEAIQQLQELVKRIDINTTTKAEITEETKKTETEVADSAEYLAPIKELIKAYKTYLASYFTLHTRSLWNEIDRLWEQVGECHKRLPHYVKQEFFNPVRFDPIPSFDVEPNRDSYRYWTNEWLDLDRLGVGTLNGLYKGARSGLREGRGSDGVAKLDLAAINHLCEQRESDLRNTLEKMLKELNEQYSGRTDKDVDMVSRSDYSTNNSFDVNQPGVPTNPTAKKLKLNTSTPFPIQNEIVTKPGTEKAGLSLTNFDAVNDVTKMDTDKAESDSKKRRRP